MARKRAKNKNPVPSSGIMGRPTLYKPEFCQALIDWGKKGNSFPTFAIEADCSYEALNQWVHSHPDFAAAKSMHHIHEMAYWENMGKAGATGQLKRVAEELYNADGTVNRRVYGPATFGQTAWLFSVKNKFPEHYRDKKELAIDPGKAKPFAPTTIAEAREMLLEAAEFLSDEEE